MGGVTCVDADCSHGAAQNTKTILYAATQKYVSHD
jgi:hypothetical protein